MEGVKKEKMRYRDLTGQKVGRWTVIERATPKGQGRSKWLCRCECGTIRVVTQQRLVMHQTQSCGCYRADSARTRNRTHGMKKSRLYRIWTGAKDRTLNPNSKYWKSYGGRGIGFYPDWLSFENFMKWANENGYTDELTLDRIDNDKVYEPSNCRWVSYEVQENNRRNTIYCIYNGERIPISILMKQTGMSRYTCMKKYREKTYG